MSLIGPAAQKEEPKLDAVLQWLESKKKNRSEDTPQGICVKQGGPDGMEKSSKFHYPLRYPLPMLYPKGGE